MANYTADDFKYEAAQQLRGTSPDGVADLERNGVVQPDAPTLQKAIESAPKPTPREAAHAYAWQNDPLTRYGPRESLTAIGMGLENVGKALDWAEKKADIHPDIARALTRTGNVAELVFHPLVQMGMRIPQATMALELGQGWKGFKNHLFPEVTQKVLGTDRSDENFNSAWDQLGYITTMGLKAAFLPENRGGKKARENFVDALDTEPLIVEREQQDIKFGDVLDKVFGEKTTDKLFQHLDDPYEKLGLTAVLQGLGDLQDPTLFVPSPSKVMGTVRFAKNMAQFGRAGAEAIEADRAVGGAIKAAMSVRGDALEKSVIATKAADAQYEKAKAAHDAAVAAGNVTAKDAAILARAEKRKDVADTVLQMHKGEAGGTNQVILGNERLRNPFAPVDDDKVISQIKLSKIPTIQNTPGNDPIETAVKSINRRLGVPTVPTPATPAFHEGSLDALLQGRRARSPKRARVVLDAIPDAPGTGKPEITREIVSPMTPGNVRLVYRDEAGKAVGFAQINNQIVKGGGNAKNRLVAMHAKTPAKAAIMSELAKAAHANGFQEIGKGVQQGAIKNLYKQGVMDAVSKGANPTEAAVESFSKHGLGRPFTPSDKFAAEAPQLVHDLQTKLTPEVYKALQTAGANLPENPRESALRMILPHPNTYVADPRTGKIMLKFETAGAQGNEVMDIEDFSKRLMYGPDPGDANATAAFRMALGANPEDLTFFDHITPFHEWRGKRAGESGLLFKDTRADQLAMAASKDEAGKPRFSKLSPEWWKEVADVYTPGVRHGNFLTNGFRLGTAHIREARRGLEALPNGREILLNLHGAKNNLERDVHATSNIVMDVLERAGIGRKDGVSLSHVDKAKSEQLFNLLDMPKYDDENLAVWHKNFKAAYDAAPKAIQEAHDELRGIFNSFARQLGLQENLHITGYAPHLFDAEHLPPELSGLRIGGEHAASGKVIFNSLLERTANLPGYERDIVAAMDYYINGAYRKIHLEPAYQRSKELAMASNSIHTAKYTDWLLQNLQGKPGTLDNWIDLATNTISRGLGSKYKWSPAHRQAVAATGLGYASAMAGNIPFLIKNLGTAALMNNAKFGFLSSNRGLWAMMTKEGRKLAEDAGVAGELNKLLDSVPGEGLLPGLRQAHGVAEKVNQKGLAGWSEGVARGWAMHAYLSSLERQHGLSLAKLHEKGLLASALRDALYASEEVHHVYGPMGRVPMGGRLGRVVEIPATMMLSFPFKQSEALLQMGKDDSGKLLKYFAYSGLMQRVAANQLGVDASGFTGLGNITQAIPSANKEEPYMTSMAMRALYSNLVAQSYITQKMFGADDIDPRKMQDALEQAAKDRANFNGLPTAAFRNTKNTVNELRTGWRMDSKGRPTYKLDKNKDLVSVLTRLPSRAERAINANAEETRKRGMNDDFIKVQELDKYFKGYMAGDRAKMDAAVAKLQRMGIPINGDPSQGFIDANAWTRALKIKLQNPTAYAHLPMLYKNSIQDSLNVRQLGPKQ